MEDKKLFILRQIVEKGFGNADIRVIDQFIHDHWIEHQQNLKGGKDVLKEAIFSIQRSFSDRKYTLLNHAIHDDMVWVHYSFTAIHTGSFMGIEPKGKKVLIDVMDIAKIENDQLVEHWGLPDRFSLMMQLKADNGQDQIG